MSFKYPESFSSKVINIFSNDDEIKSLVKNNDLKLGDALLKNIKNFSAEEVVSAYAKLRNHNLYSKAIKIQQTKIMYEKWLNIVNNSNERI